MNQYALYNSERTTDWIKRSLKEKTINIHVIKTKQSARVHAVHKA